MAADRDLIPLKEAAAAIGVSVDALRRRIRRGTIQAEKESAPPYRWMVAVPGDARTDVGPPPGERVAALEAQAAALTVDNEVMRRELTVLHEVRAGRTVGRSENGACGVLWVPSAVARW